MGKPTYLKNINADWSGQYYGEALVPYFVNQSCEKITPWEINTGHWYYQITCEKPNLLFDLVCFYVRKDFSSIAILKHSKTNNKESWFEKDDHQHRHPLTILYAKSKNSWSIFWKRIFYLREFKKFFPLSFRNVLEFLNQPVYVSVSFM